MPSLDEKYDIEIKVISKPRAEFLTDDYFSLDLPCAPAIMVGGEIVVEGTDVEDHLLEAIICRHLGLPEPKPEKKGILKRFRK